jgi:hypothetical protein
MELQSEKVVGDVPAAGRTASITDVRCGIVAAG